MEWLGSELGFKKYSDWYNIKTADLEDNKGGGLLRKYDSSAVKVVTNVFPNHKWLIWKFSISFWLLAVWVVGYVGPVGSVGVYCWYCLLLGLFLGLGLLLCCTCWSCC